MMIPVIALSEIDQVVSIQDMSTIICRRIIVIPQIYRVDELIIVRSSRSKSFRESIVKTKLDHARGLIPTHLQTVVVSVEVVIQRIDVLIEREWPEKVLLGCGHFGDATGSLAVR